MRGYERGRSAREFDFAFAWPVSSWQPDRQALVLGVEGFFPWFVRGYRVECDVNQIAGGLCYVSNRGGAESTRTIVT